MNTLNDRAAEILAAVRQSTPLVHNITNFVVMNVTANALLPSGRRRDGPCAGGGGRDGRPGRGAGAQYRHADPEWVPAMIRAGRAAGLWESPWCSIRSGPGPHGSGPNCPNNPEGGRCKNCPRQCIGNPGAFLHCIRCRAGPFIGRWVGPRHPRRRRRPFGGRGDRRRKAPGRGGGHHSGRHRPEGCRHRRPAADRQSPTAIR